MATPKQDQQSVVVKLPCPKPWAHHAEGDDPNYRDAYVPLPEGGRMKVAPKLDA